MKKLLLFSLIPILSFSQTQIGNDINGEAADDLSGASISLSKDGKVLAIGAIENDGNGTNSGHVRVFRFDSESWKQIGSDINGEKAGDRSGASVSLSYDGSVLAIGAIGNDGNGSNSGHVRVYSNISDTWQQVGDDINGETILDFSGQSISLSSDGTFLAIGSIYNDENGSNSGHVRIFNYVSEKWVQVGTDINGEAIDDWSSFSISLSSDGNVVAISAIQNDGKSIDVGHVRVYRNIAGIWTQIGSDIEGENTDDQSGWSVSLSSDGNIVAIGARNNDGNGNNSGHVRVYRNVSDQWVQIGEDIDGEAIDDYSGVSVSLSSDGNIVAIGARENDGNGNNSGHVRIYRNSSDSWKQIGIDIDGETAEEFSGISVSLSSDGSTVAIGAAQNFDNGFNSGQVRVYNLTEALSNKEFVQVDFSIYPNPTSEKITIHLNNEYQLKKVNLYNALGQLVKTENNNIISIEKMAKGNYFLEVVTNKGKTTKTIVIE
jgi:hypothetical protein